MNTASDYCGGYDGRLIFRGRRVCAGGVRSITAGGCLLVLSSCLLASPLQANALHPDRSGNTRADTAIAASASSPPASSRSGTSASAAVLSGPVIKANDFLNTMGAVTHDIQQKESAAAIISGFKFTGLRIGRDDATHNSSGAGSVQDLCDIHAATGVLYHELPIVDDGNNSIADTQAMWHQLAGCGAMLEAEGPNEPNNQPFVYNGATCGGGGSFLPCAQYQRDLYKMVKSDPVLSGFAMAGLTEPGAEPDDVGLQFLTIPPGSGLAMADGTVYADIANTHNYAQGNGTAGTSLMDNHARIADTIQPGLFDAYGDYWGPTWGRQFSGGSTGQNDRPKETTETGWNIYKPGANIGWDAMARLVTDLYLDAVQLGWSETIVYKMFEEPPYDSGNGMFNPNGNEADAGNATTLGLYIHNLTTILADNSSSFSAVPVSVSVSNLPATGYYQLMEKSTGVYELVLWGEAFASQTSTTVTVSLPSAVSARIYDVTQGTNPVQTVNAQTIPVVLNDHAMIVEWGGGSFTVSTPTATPASKATPTPTTTSAPKATPTPARPVSSLPSGTYRISLSGQSVDGGFGYWGGTPPVQLYPDNTGGCQSWTWDGSTLLNGCPDMGRGAWTGHLMADAGNGTVSEPTTLPADTWTVTPSGAGWMIRNNRSGNYLSDEAGTLALSSIKTVWSLNLFPGTPPPTPAPTPAAGKSVAASTPTPTRTPTPASTPAPAGSLASGTYRISLSGQSVDGGFGYWGGTPPVQLYPDNTGGCQSWTWNGSTLLNDCPDQGRGPWTGHFMADAGNGTVSEPTTPADTWTVKPSGAGWIIRNNRTGKYLSDQAGKLVMSSTKTVWSIDFFPGDPPPTPVPTPVAGSSFPVSTPTPAPTAPMGSLAGGTYRISLAGQSVDGGFGYWGGTPAVQLYPDNTGGCQSWTWNGSTLLNDCPDQGRGPWTGHFMADAGNGTVSEPATLPSDIWTITPSGAGWIVRNNRTGNYLSDAAGTLAMSSTQTVWNIDAFQANPATTPTPTLDGQQQATRCSPVWTSPTDALHPLTVAGTITLSFIPNCNGAFAYAVLFIGCPDNPVFNHGVPLTCPSTYPFFQFTEGGAASFSFDTHQLPDMSFDVGLGLYNSAGVLLGGLRDAAPAGTDGDMVLTIAN